MAPGKKRENYLETRIVAPIARDDVEKYAVRARERSVDNIKRFFAFLNALAIGQIAIALINYLNVHAHGDVFKVEFLYLCALSYNICITLVLVYIGALRYMDVKYAEKFDLPVHWETYVYDSVFFSLIFIIALYAAGTISNLQIASPAGGTQPVNDIVEKIRELIQVTAAIYIMSMFWSTTFLVLIYLRSDRYEDHPVQKHVIVINSITLVFVSGAVAAVKLQYVTYDSVTVVLTVVAAGIIRTLTDLWLSWWFFYPTLHQDSQYSIVKRECKDVEYFSGIGRNKRFKISKVRRYWKRVNMLSGLSDVDRVLAENRSERLNYAMAPNYREVVKHRVFAGMPRLPTLVLCWVVASASIYIVYIWK